MRKALIAVFAIAMLVFAGAAVAAKTGSATPWKYDPGHTGTVVANWSKEGLSLQKNTATTTNAAAGADIKGVEGEKLTSLSFEVKGYCGAGAPRFNVYDDANTLYYLGCTYGEKTDAGNGWTKVTFNGDELGGIGAFDHTITRAGIVMDEQGQTLLRNISVDDIAITR
jgi:hypothetical protein